MNECQIIVKQKNREYIITRNVKRAEFDSFVEITCVNRLGTYLPLSCTTVSEDYNCDSSICHQCINLRMYYVPMIVKNRNIEYITVSM